MFLSKALYDLFSREIHMLRGHKDHIDVNNLTFKHITKKKRILVKWRLTV